MTFITRRAIQEETMAEAHDENTKLHPMIQRTFGRSYFTEKLALFPAKITAATQVMKTYSSAQLARVQNAGELCENVKCGDIIKLEQCFEGTEKIYLYIMM